MQMRNAVMLTALLAVLAFGMAAPAIAASTTIPSAADIEGYYAASIKYYGYDFVSPAPWKGGYQDVFRVTRVSDTEVQLDWMDFDGYVYWTYRAHYLNGTLVIGIGDETAEPAGWAETMILQFSGTPGKIKFTGNYIYYEMARAYVFVATVKGKFLTTPL